MACASERSSCGAASSSMGRRSLGLRPSTSRRSRAIGARPAPTPAHTIMLISTIRTDSGSIVSISSRRASSSRLALERATCTSMVCWARGFSPNCRYSAATRTGETARAPSDSISPS